MSDDAEKELRELESRSSLQTLQEFSIPLIAGVVAAVVWANVSPGGYHHLVHASPFGPDSHYNFHFLMNDIFMVFFFGIAAKEITEACLPGGALNPPSRAVNPLMGTVGGVVGPVAVFFLWVAITGDKAAYGGWGIPTATDIALAWLVARLAFGRGHPAVSFLLLLAVVDDGIGLAIIAVFYPDPAHPVQPLFLVVVLGAMVLALMLRRARVVNFWAYLLGPGALSWYGLYAAHLHPALGLVAIVPFMPSGGVEEGLFAETHGGRTERDTLNHFEHAFKLPVDLGLFGFGLANAGVAFSSVGNVTWAVFAALVIGKTVGIFSFSFVADRLGFKLPSGMGFRSLLVAGITAGLGLTVALFVAGVAFTDPGLQGAAKMGALFSAGVIPLVLIVAKVLNVKNEGKPLDQAAPEAKG